MKKTLASILCFMCVTLASNAAGIGYINYDVLSKNYSLAKKYTNNLNNKVNSIKTYTAQKDKEMNNAVNRQSTGNNRRREEGKKGRI